MLRARDLARAAKAKQMEFLADNEGYFFIFGFGGGARAADEANLTSDLALLKSLGCRANWADSGVRQAHPTHPPKADKNVCPTKDFRRAL